MRHAELPVGLSGIRPLVPPPRTSNLNTFAKRWVGSIKQECLSKLILVGKSSLRRASIEYFDHHHFERNHQAKGNLLLLLSPDRLLSPERGTIRCRERLGGLLKLYTRAA